MMSPMVRRSLVFGAKVLVILLLAGLALYRVRFSPVKVLACKVVRGSVVNEVMGTGTLEARVSSSISPEISGLLVQVLVDQDDAVAKGQLLARLDDRDLLQQVEMAKAGLAAATASIDLAEAEVVQSQAIATQARANFTRIASLREGQAASQSDLDKAVEARDVAEAGLRRAGLAKVEAQVMATKAEASLRYSQARLANTDIHAPFAGLVVRRHLDPGNVVVPGTSILEMISTDQLWISAWVDETAMGLLAEGQPARIVFRSSPDAPRQGHVIRLAPKTDSETREFLVDVGVDQLPERWAVGQRAEVYIEAGRRDGVLILPQRFLTWRDGAPWAMVEEGGKARWRKVSIGLKGRDQVEVSDGLAEGQVVIAAAPGAALPRVGRAIRHDQP